MGVIMNLPTYVSRKLMEWGKFRKLAINASLLYSALIPSEGNPISGSCPYNEMQVDEHGNMIRRISRAAGDDTTKITERNPATGRFETHRYTPIKNDDGTWRMGVDLPRVYQLQFRPREG